MFTNPLLTSHFSLRTSPLSPLSSRFTPLTSHLSPLTRFLVLAVLATRAVADDTASFASATGLVFDASSLLGGPRAKRAAIVIVSIELPIPLWLSLAFRMTTKSEQGR
jgi:hypothetical protein